MVNPRSKARVEARIQERVAHCVAFELNDPRAAFITVTRVEATDDLSTARIFYSVLGTEGDKSKAAHMLESATGFVRKQVGRVLRTRFIPALRWVYDDSSEVSAQMQQSIQDALAKDRAINPAAHADLPRPKGSVQADEAELEYLDFLNQQEEEDKG